MTPCASCWLMLNKVKIYIYAVKEMVILIFFVPIFQCNINQHLEQGFISCDSSSNTITSFTSERNMY